MPHASSQEIMPQCGLGLYPSTAKFRVAPGIRILMPSSSFAAITWQPSRDLRSSMYSQCQHITSLQEPGLYLHLNEGSISNRARFSEAVCQVQHVVLVVCGLWQFVI